MKIQARTQPLARYPVLEGLGVVKRLGFDGVEICLENEDVAPDRLSDALVDRIREQVHHLDLAPYSISYHRDYIYDDELFELTKQAIAWTPKFGTDILVFAGTLARTHDLAEWALLIKRTRELVAVAERYGVVLAQEFEPRFIVGCTRDLLRLLADIPSPSLAVNLDLGHVFLCDPDPLQAIAQLGTKIVHVHIEDMRTGVHDHLLPGEGDMDLGAYIEMLARVGFQGGMSLDLYKHDYEVVAPEAVRYLRALVARTSR